ncbi:MAG: Kup system potassium uptake protein [Ilumatobacteraceae bacterium]|nr:Kup system potassium uptake protein [Ilumatobacteraceae bacterium]
MQRVESVEHEQGLTEVTMRYGFTDDTPIAADLATHLAVRSETTYYFVGRETVRPTGRPSMARWREMLFASMNRNSGDAHALYQLPADRIVEIGSPVEI